MKMGDDKVEDRTREIATMRTAMGTASKTAGENKTEYVRGGEKIKVRMISPAANMYHGMFVMATSTWGGVEDSGVDKWNNASVEARQQVVLAILQRKALPLALEHPTFLFEITGCSRSAFDQIARARIGTTFASMGVRDNAHPDIDVVVPPHLYDNPKALQVFMKGIEAGKLAYSKLLEGDTRASWQDARAVLPMGMMHRFCMNVNYMALGNFMSRRLQFCEQYDTVSVAWKMRQELGRHYALLAEPLRPGCDFAKRCTYHEADSIGEAFGCLFKGCGRWEDPYPLAEFNESAADVDDIVMWMDEKVPAGDDPIDWDTALETDRHWFEEELV